MRISAGRPVLAFSEGTLEWLDEEQVRRGGASYAEIIDELVVAERRRTARLVRVRKSEEERRESQRQNGKKRWQKVEPVAISATMQLLGARSWAAFPTPEARSQEMRRRMPRPPHAPRPPKPKLIGKREHVCPEHLRDYTQGRGLFGKYHGLFSQSEHVRGRRRAR